MRVFWLFEAKNARRKGMVAYVREAVGEYVTEYPRPSSPWMRIIPPPKVIELTKELEEIIELGKEAKLKKEKSNNSLK